MIFDFLRSENPTQRIARLGLRAIKKAHSDSERLEAGRRALDELKEKADGDARKGVAEFFRSLADDLTPGFGVMVQREALEAIKGYDLSVDRPRAIGDTGMKILERAKDSNALLAELAKRNEQKWAQELKGPAACVVGIPCTRFETFFGPGATADAYARSVVKAGAYPKILYQAGGNPRQQLDSVHAMVVPGGLDVHPRAYKEFLGPRMDYKMTDESFDDFELELLRRSYETGLPVLGICRGEQLMNVAAGGTLKQDINSDHQPVHGVSVTHRAFKPNYDPAHPIVILPGSVLSGVLGGVVEIMVNSLHHQCVGKLGNNMKISAVAADGVVEGIERQGAPFQIGVQFHPERLGGVEGLFKTLVAHGKRRAHPEQVPAAPAPSTPAALAQSSAGAQPALAVPPQGNAACEVTPGSFAPRPRRKFGNANT
jgi:putative glutamine amidotransferase